MKIKSVKAKYEIQAASKLKICFEIDQDESVCESRCLSFDPESEDYGLIGVLSIYDKTEEGLVQTCEEQIDLQSKLQYGFLDELIENAIFKRLRVFKGRMGNPDKIGSYWTDDPEVVWLMRKETFKTVVRGWAIHDRRTFSGEIVGENTKGDVIRLLLKDDRNAQLYRNDELMKEGMIVLRYCASEEGDGNGKATGKVEKIRFKDILDEIETHLKKTITARMSDLCKNLKLWTNKGM